MRAQMIGLGVMLLAVQACSDGPTASDAEVTRGGDTARLDCASLITPEATDPLGWPADGPEEHAGRCQLTTERGQVTVGTRAVAAGSQERANAVRQEFEAQCDRLRADGPDFVGEPAWIADGTSGCLTQVDPQTRTGVAELILLNREDEVVQIRISAARPVPVSRVGEAFRRLAAGSLDLCEASCA